MLKIFEPNTLPTERADPPDTAAINATVNSGKVVDMAMSVKPTEVLPIRVIAATFKALFIAILLAQFSASKDTAIINMLTNISAATNSTTSIAPFTIEFLFWKNEFYLPKIVPSLVVCDCFFD
jgi:hypothetical protein